MSRSDKKNGYRVMRVYLVCNLLVVLVVTMSIAGDWIVTGIGGEHWAIADSVFRHTYEEV